MRGKLIRRAAIAVGGMASLAAASVWYWDGGSAGWSTNNWGPHTQCQGLTCWPKTTDDDAVIEDGAVTITFSESLTIDDVVLGGDPENLIIFDTDGPTEYTVTADTITITGGVQMKQLAGMIAEGEDPSCE